MARGSGSGSRRGDHSFLITTNNHRGRGRRVENKVSAFGVLFEDQLNRRRVIEARKDVLAFCLFLAHLIVFHGRKARLLVRSLGRALFSV